MAKKEISIVLRAKNAMARGLARAKKSLASFGKGIGKIGKNLAKTLLVAGGQIGALGTYFVKAASDAEETRTKFEAVFSSITVSASDTAQSLAKDFNLAASTSEKLLGNTGDLLVGFGFAEDQALDLSDKVNRLAIDLASFTNYSGGASGASQALTKALLGETESAKSLGIVIRQNTKEFKDSVASMMESKGVTEQQARSLVILEQAMRQTEKAQGDYQRTQDGMANSVRKVQEGWKGFREEVGKAIMDSSGMASITSKLADRINHLTQQVTDFIDSGQVDYWAQEAKNALQSIIPILQKIGAGFSFLGDRIKETASFFGDGRRKETPRPY